MATTTPAAPATDVPARGPARRRLRQGRAEARAGWAFLLPFGVMFTLVFLVPIVIALRASLFKSVASGGGLYGGGELVESFVGLGNYIDVLTNERFWAGMGRVVLYAAFQIPVMIVLALAIALLLDSLLVRRVGALRLSVFLPYAIPGVVAAMVWLYLYSPEISPFVKLAASLGFDLNFMGSTAILASMANMTTWTYTGYNMLIFLAALQAIPHDIYSAARIDGASSWQIVRHIKIPLVRGASLLAVLLSIIGTVQLFNEPTIMATANSWMGADYTPMMMAYNTMMGEISPSGDGPASAISIVMAIFSGLLAVVYTLLQRKADR